jgi:ribose transport system permease protein
VLPWAVVVLVVVGLGAGLWLHATTFGKQLFAVGGNAGTAGLSGVPVVRVRILAFVLSGLCASIAGILIGGLFPLSQNAGAGYGFQALSAVVLGGAVLGGGRGSMPAAMAGALVLLALFALLNIEGFSAQLQPAVQGAVIIGAMAYAGLRLRRSA